MWSPQEAQEGAGPLAGLKVVELADGVGAPFCAKLLGDLGADVIKVEGPGGDASRRRGPFPRSGADPEQSAAFLYLNTSKRSIVLDLAGDADRALFRALVADADVLVEDRTPGTLDEKELGWAALREANPALVMTSLTPYGQTGPKRLHRLHHLNLYHAAGHASPFSKPEAGRAPARAGGYLGEYDAGLTAALGTLAALLGRRDSGSGQHVDVSAQEAMMNLERVTIGRFANEADPFSGRGGPGGLSRARDGWVMLTTLEAHQWEGMLRMMDSPAWAQEDWARTPEGRVEHMEDIARRKDEWCGTRDREEIYHAAQAEGTPAAPVRDVAEVRAWRQPRARGFFHETPHPRAGRLELPGGPYAFSKTPWVGGRAPLLDEHGPALRDALATASDAPKAPAASPAAPAAAAKGPLSGIRIADFTWAWAGPQGALLLRMLGAEVIKIESRARLDHARVHSLTAGSMTGGIDESPVFNDLNLGKHSITLNLRSDGGRDLVRRLVAESDVVLQNMRPGVLDRLGLGYDDLVKVRPDLIMLSSSAVGATGPEGHYAGYAPTFACLSGIASISGHPDEAPNSLSGSVDLRVGTASAFAVLAALHHRERTGEGQSIDLSSTEVMSAMMGDAFVGEQLSGEVPGRIGNRDDWMAPHGCYACRGEGEVPTHVSIAVDGEEEWAAFRKLVGDPALDAPELATAADRKHNEDALDEIVERWTRERDVDAIVDALQGAGIAAARVHSGASLARDPHLAARGVYEPVHHPLLGELRVVRPPWRIEGARTPGPAPMIGQHNEVVLGELLGMSDAEIQRLADEKIVY